MDKAKTPEVIGEQSESPKGTTAPQPKQTSKPTAKRPQPPFTEEQIKEKYEACKAYEAKARLDKRTQEMRDEIDKTICHGNYFLVSVLVKKIDSTLRDEVGVDIPALHKMRVGVNDQQPERRMPVVDAQLRAIYDEGIQACGADEDDEMIQISQYISELELMRSRLGDKFNDPSISKVVKVSDFPELSTDNVFKLANCQDIIEFTSCCREAFLSQTMPLAQYPALVRHLMEKTDATEKTKGVINHIRDKMTHITKFFKDPEEFNRIINEKLTTHPVDYLIIKFLNDMSNTTINVEVKTERLHRTMAMLEEQYKNKTELEPVQVQINKYSRYLALKMYGQQTEVDKIIEADKKADGSDGHLSSMKQNVFYDQTEPHIREAAQVQADRILAERILRDRKRRDRKQYASAGNPHSDEPYPKRGKLEDVTNKENTDNRGKPHKKGERTRACPYCKVDPAPHRFSMCPQKAATQAAKKAANKDRKPDITIGQLAITHGKVEELTDSE